MKISYNWLKEYLQCNLETKDIALLLTDIGLEVEAVEHYESVKGGLKNFVTGRVETAERHPNADKLSLTTVDVGRESLLNIVCGAPNVAAGQKVIVALEGAIVYKGNDQFEIKRSKIRGEASEGMICAEDELGIGTSHDGILVLPQDTRIGIPASEYFKIVNDTIFEIGITPNHADALSHIGVARDLAAAIKVRNLGTATFILPNISNFAVDNHELTIEVKVDDIEACPRYAGITVQGVNVKPSPSWMQDRLKAIGVRPINNIVDISNYILFEYGQPLHTFDADAIEDKKVVVRKAKEGSKFTTLDNIERTLTSDDLLIANANEGMCIAGVFGGIKSGVTENTKAIFIESAYFDPVTIRKTSKKHGLKTDASFRFERGIDPNITVVALKRAAMMIKEIAGGEISSELVDIYAKPIQFTSLDLKYSDINRLIGHSLSHDVVNEILKSLEIKIEKIDGDNLSVSIPPFKVDVKNLSDIVEEVLRIYGYNKIDSDQSMKISVSYNVKPDSDTLYNHIADYLVSNNFNEILTNSFNSASYYSDKFFKTEEIVALLNPLSKDLDVMRSAMVFSGLEAIAYNMNRKQNTLKFFEFGKVFKKNVDTLTKDVTSKYSEKKILALYVTGKKYMDHWNYNDEAVDFFYLNGLVFNIIKRMGVNTASLSEDDIGSIYSIGKSYKYNNKPLLSIGVLKKELSKVLDVSQDVIAAFIEWDQLVAIAQKNKVSHKEVSKFPEVRRDLALILEKEVTYQQIENLAFRTNKHLLKRVNLFDVYEGEKIDEGKKSYAVSFILQDESKTLTDKEIDSFMNKLSKVLETELGARIRK